LKSRSKNAQKIKAQINTLYDQNAKFYVKKIVCFATD